MCSLRVFDHLPVRPFVHMFIRSQYWTKTAKHGLTQTTPYDSPGNLFSVAKDRGKIPTGSPQRS